MPVAPGSRPGATGVRLSARLAEVRATAYTAARRPIAEAAQRSTSRHIREVAGGVRERRATLHRATVTCAIFSGRVQARGEVAARRARRFASLSTARGVAVLATAHAP